VVKAAKKEEFGRNKEEFEDDLHQDKNEDSRKPPAVVKEEKDEPEDTKHPPTVIKEEEGYGYETDENEEHEWEDSKKPPAAVKEEVEDEVGSEYSPSESDEEGSEYSPGESDEESIGLLPPARPSRPMAVTKPKSAKPVAHAATPVPIVQTSSALAPKLADEKRGARCRGNVRNEKWALSDEHKATYTRKWNRMYEKIRAFKKSHGHCELFWVVDRFTLIWNTPLTHHLSLSLNCMQVT
jgi:hypothetical protein